jgi:23S rRNA A2030 N6-methylase RlmJ
LSIYPTDVQFALNGSGFIIINPPWQFKEKVMTFLPWLWEQLSIDKQGEYVCKTLRTY